MNTHLPTRHNPKLADALGVLSPEPVNASMETPHGVLRRRVRPLGLAALIGIAIVSIAVFQSGPVDGIPAQAQPPESPDIAGRPAMRRPVIVPREITGSGFVVAPRRTTVFSKYEGRVRHVAVEAGEVVEQGQVVVMLDDAGALFALEQARAAKAAAELVLAARNIDAAQARGLLERARTLAARQAASRQTLEEAHSAFERASNAIAQARQGIANAELSIRIAGERVAELTVRAPFAGTVTRLDAHAGDTVLARADSVRESQSLLTITDTGSMVIDVDVAETTMVDLKPGLKGEAVLDGFANEPFAVEVLRLAPVASAEKGTVTLRLSLIGPPAGIRPNMAARIRIFLVDENGDTTQ